jgi:hypothetical protein
VNHLWRWLAKLSQFVIIEIHTWCRSHAQSCCFQFFHGDSLVSDCVKITYGADLVLNHSYRVIRGEGLVNDHDMFEFSHDVGLVFGHERNHLGSKRYVICW